MGCGSAAFTDPQVPYFPLIISQGEDVDQQINWLQPDKVTPIPMAGYSADMQVRVDASSPNVVLDLSTANSGLTLGASNGQVHILISDTVTQGLLPGQYVYDIKFTPPSGKEFFWIKGAFTVVATVTRP